jgi:hypothetical protein
LNLEIRKYAYEPLCQQAVIVDGAAGELVPIAAAPPAMTTPDATLSAAQRPERFRGFVCHFPFDGPDLHRFPRLEDASMRFRWGITT